MKIDHMDGSVTETETLPDVDAILMEESQKLHSLFAKYGRQLFLDGEIRAGKGCLFFHITTPEVAKDPEAFNLAINRFYASIDGGIRQISRSTLGIGRIPPPEVQPYSTPEQ